MQIILHTYSNKSSSEYKQEKWDTNEENRNRTKKRSDLMKADSGKIRKQNATNYVPRACPSGGARPLEAIA